MDQAQNIGKEIINFLDAHPWILITLVAHGAILLIVAYLILLERKVASWVQDRIGPNRVGLGFGIIPFLKDKKMMGLGQPLADGVKFILKEDYQPKGVDKYLFTAAPIMMIIVVIISIAVLPWGGIKQTTRDLDVAAWTTQPPADLAALTAGKVHSALPIDGTMLGEADRIEDRQNSDGSWEHHQIASVTYRYNFQTASLNIGVLFVLAALSLAVYGVVIGGWASNNKYSFLGGLRATANMISYEIPLGLAVLCVVIVFGTLNLEEIVNKQAYSWHLLGFIPIPAWNIWSQPYAFIMFLVCIHAEANRAPFDLAEAEQELVGGYHTEYSAMRFALFFLGEYAGMVTTSVVCVALFFGGWHFPGVDRFVAWIVNHLTHSDAWVAGPVTNSLVVCIVRAVVMMLKTLVIIFIFMWTRWSLPRFRFDQLLNLAWRGLIPISLALLMVTAIVVYWFGGAPNDGQTLSGGTTFALFVANVILLGVSIVVGAKLPSTDSNRKIRVPHSRFLRTPLPASAGSASNN